MHGNGLLLAEAFVEILALEHPRDAVFRAETHDFVARQFVQPLTVVADLRLLGVENLEDLIEIRFCVGIDLFARERRTGFRLARRVADQGGEITNQEDGLVS